MDPVGFLGAPPISFPWELFQTPGGKTFRGFIAWKFNTPRKAPLATVQYYMPQLVVWEAEAHSVSETSRSQSSLCNTRIAFELEKKCIHFQLTFHQTIAQFYD